MELDALYERGWRHRVFIVDDNFIGNKNKLKTEILPALVAWMKRRKYPFGLFTEVSMNIADDEELMRLMVNANFDTVFIGIETPNEKSLAECGKFQNMKRDLLASVKKIQNYGLEVQGGFIVGFDNDTHTIFDRQISFIQRSGIVTAMVGLLNAIIGTKLYYRLKMENRLVEDFPGNNTDCSINFTPKMKLENLISGYKKIVGTIYAYKQYYERIRTFLEEYRKQGSIRLVSMPRLANIISLVKSIWYIGFDRKGGGEYWKLLAWTLLKRPRALTIAVTLAIYGYHFRKITEDYTQII